MKALRIISFSAFRSGHVNKKITALTAVSQQSQTKWQDRLAKRTQDKFHRIHHGNVRDAVNVTMKAEEFEHAIHELGPVLPRHLSLQPTSRNIND